MRRCEIFVGALHALCRTRGLSFSSEARAVAYSSEH